MSYLRVTSLDNSVCCPFIPQVTLQSRAPTIASEYYTHQEMESFKKPKRRRKIKRKLRGKFTVDELMPDKKSKSAQDHGSR